MPDRIITKLEEIQNEFIWEGKKSLVKYKTMVADYTDGGLKMLHIKAKFMALKLAWVRRLCSSNLHKWMAIPKKFIKISETFFPNIKPYIDPKLPLFINKCLIIGWKHPITQ